jgi:hypothetical protein
MFWLTSALILFVVFGLLRMQIAVSKMMKNEDAKFEVVTFKEGIFSGEQILKRLYDQKLYAANVRKLSAFALVLAVSCSAMFLTTLF